MDKLTKDWLKIYLPNNIEAFSIFPNMLSERLDDLYYGELPKGKFIGKYMQEIKQLGLDESKEIHLKYPQFVSQDSDNRDNNWLDFILKMDENVFNEFKRGIQ